MLRGGPLAERRVIDLLNRRFVTYYFNVGKGQRGYNQEASDFVHKFDKRFRGRSVPTPPVWVVSPEGSLLATIDNYLPKDKFFAQLRKVLDKNAEFDAHSDEDKRVLKLARREPFGAASLHFELGKYKAAAALLTKIKGDAAKLMLARIARYEGRWEDAGELLKETDGKTYAAAVALERGFRMIHGKKFEDARKLLVKAIRAHPSATEIGGLHFYAGVANFMLQRREWANFHFCWVMKNAPDDHNYMRAYMAATAEAMPYPNAELGGYRGKARMISHAKADAARAKSMKDYDRLKEKFEKAKEGVKEEGADKPRKDSPAEDEEEF